MSTHANGDYDSTEELSFQDAIKDIGRFPALYSAVVGAPSKLAIIQAIIKQWRLTPAFQWIVDGYSSITAQLGSYVEPFILPAIAWIHSVLHWPLVLYPHLRPVFLLLSIFIVAVARSY